MLDDGRSAATAHDGDAAAAVEAIEVPKRKVANANDLLNKIP